MAPDPLSHFLGMFAPSSLGEFACTKAWIVTPRADFTTLGSLGDAVLV